MRIAFYAPMKPPDNPIPSGDRRMAGLLMRALSAGGHEVRLASRYCSYEGTGDPVAQRRHRLAGAVIAAAMARGPADPFDGQGPDLWFTYHLYHKAPDWIGPSVADRLGIPYVVAEASHAPKQAAGPWHVGHGGAAAAIRRADRIVSLNPRDEPCLRMLRGGAAGIARLAPFIDAPAPTVERIAVRSALADRLGLDPAIPWLLTVAMMRPGAKLASYRVLGAALATLCNRPWHLIVAGDGQARGDVERALPGDGRGTLLGTCAAEEVAALSAAADLFLWPAVREGYGMALLEAQAAGLPVVAGRTPGVATIVADGRTGRLTVPDDARAFAEAVGDLLDHPDRRRAMGEAARRKILRHHDLAGAARRLDTLLASIVRDRAA